MFCLRMASMNIWRSQRIQNRQNENYSMIKLLNRLSIERILVRKTIFWMAIAQLVLPFDSNDYSIFGVSCGIAVFTYTIVSTLVSLFSIVTFMDGLRQIGELLTFLNGYFIAIFFVLSRTVGFRYLRPISRIKMLLLVILIVSSFQRVAVLFSAASLDMNGIGFRLWQITCVLLIISMYSFYFRKNT
jgi:hypothetical protein